MTLDERIKEALRRLKHGLGAMRIPADECDADLVLSECQTQLARLAAFATTVDAIRNDIIGTQSLNWSRHAYPLVAALHEVGFDGIGYANARAEALTTLKAFEVERAKVARLRVALERMLASAFPNPDDHPSMTRAWAAARMVLRETGGES